jgi:hypothetical protein
MTRREQIAETDPDILFMDGHDDALIGIAMRFGMNEVACYDYDKVIAGLRKGGMTDEEAQEWFEFNQIGSWVGDYTPVFVRLIPAEAEVVKACS